jgi:hypothetical protein
MHPDSCLASASSSCYSNVILLSLIADEGLGTLVNVWPSCFSTETLSVNFLQAAFLTYAMANPFRHQDAASPTGGTSEPSVPMPRFGISGSKAPVAAEDPSVRFPPAEELAGRSFDTPKLNTSYATNEAYHNVAGSTASTIKPLGTFDARPESKHLATAQVPVPPSPQTAKQRASRMLDVESFKNLLMTGNVDAGGSGTTLSSTKGSINVDGDSISSIEPATSQGQISKRVADNADSSSEFSESEPEEYPKTAGVQKATSLKGKPPPPPKSRHGKAIQRGPQTVSFDDFEPSLERTDSRPERPEHKRMGSFSKPLPPTPQIPLVPKLSIPESDDGSTPTPPESLLNESMATPKKAAPPPPVARRSTVTKRPRRNTASSMQSVTEDHQPPSRAPSIADSSLKSPPPPPPTRRMGSSSSIMSPQAPPEISRPTLDNATSRSRSSSQVSLASPPPAPPARRRSSRTSIELNQRPSSLASGNQSRGPSTEIVRSSFDSQRPHMTATHSDQPIAEESVEHEPSSVPETPVSRPTLPALPSGDDILADMEALQKEIDDLRAKYEKP